MEAKMYNVQLRFFGLNEGPGPTVVIDKLRT